MPGQRHVDCVKDGKSVPFGGGAVAEESLEWVDLRTRDDLIRLGQVSLGE